ncbi:MAG: KH domain-containing protein [Clostridia bacterium]|nr:KH domain-containing protein [Clostridia bacterium]
MIKEAFGKGATTEAAVEAAKAELGAPWDADVQIEILKTASKKIFGLFGGSLAEARAYYEIPDAPKKEEKPKKQPQAPKAPKKADKPQEKKAEVKEVKAKEVKEVKAVKEEAPVVVAPAKEKTVGEASVKAEKYIRSILEGMGVSEAEISACEDDEGVEVQLNCGNDYGYVIGRRGETLDAIQYLTRLVINKGSDGYKRVSINAGNYREKRVETLRELAKKNAARVKKYGRNATLDPMNPYERRIIHTTIQEIEGVDSHSVGSESDRRVVITLAEGFKATNPGRDNRRGGRNDYRRKDNYKKSAPAAEPTRAPRSDSAGSLYGKIEPKSKVEE